MVFLEVCIAHTIDRGWICYGDGSDWNTLSIHVDRTLRIRGDFSIPAAGTASHGTNVHVVTNNHCPDGGSMRSACG
jgi:hypothetical protein